MTNKIMELADQYAKLHFNSDDVNELAQARAALAAEVEKLENEALSWKICNERTSGAARDLQTERYALRVEVEKLNAYLMASISQLAAAQADAARYKWLRSKATAEIVPMVRVQIMQRGQYLLHMHGDLDAAIDAAMREGGGA